MSEDRSCARLAHEAFRAPLRFLSGNHDVGEPGEGPWMGLVVASERVRAHRDAFGPDRFLELADSWAVVGLNSELLGCRCALIRALAEGAPRLLEPRLP